MHQLQLFIGNWQSDEKAAAQARYLTALLLCSLLLVGFSAGVFGWKPLVLALIAGVAGSVVEFAFSAVRKKPVTGGAFVYGLALSLLVPPTMPWWVILLAAIAGTVFAKEVFGGAKNAIFNPALIGAAMILFSYPATTAGASMGNLNAIEGGVGWENGIWLLLGCLAIQILSNPSSLFIYLPLALMPWLLATYVIPDQKLPLEGNLQLIFSEDCFLLAGILLAVDPGNAPRRWPGKIIYGFIVGTLSILMRCFAKYPFAMVFAILIADCIAPSLDMLFAPKAKEEAAK